MKCAGEAARNGLKKLVRHDTCRLKTHQDWKSAGHMFDYVKLETLALV